MYLADYHVHSSCSPDGHVTMADMAAEGIRRGLNEICFTDHVDTIQWGTTHLRTDTFDWAAVEKQYADAAARYGDRIRLKLGAELGEAYLGFDCAEKQMAGAPPLDFVIGSVHMPAMKPAGSTFSTSTATVTTPITTPSSTPIWRRS